MRCICNMVAFQFRGVDICKGQFTVIKTEPDVSIFTSTMENRFMDVTLIFVPVAPCLSVKTMRLSVKSEHHAPV